MIRMISISFRKLCLQLIKILSAFVQRMVKRLTIRVRMKIKKPQIFQSEAFRDPAGIFYRLINRQRLNISQFLILALPNCSPRKEYKEHQFLNLPNSFGLQLASSAIFQTSISIHYRNHSLLLISRQSKL